ncbi:MAG: FAD-dependent oxidoreductase, partial [Synergistetes bacterium]|nr:FAD-dependent oxidoreductase [Synergistota bacterium]
MIEKDVVIIGAGPAGMAAAVSAKESGIENLLLIERENKIGGILNQCIHDGFGLHNFRENLTGPEYIERYLSEIKRLNVDVMSNTMVVNLSKDRTLTVSNPNGRFRIKAKSVILAMGCRERTRGAISIPGSR